MQRDLTAMKAKKNSCNALMDLHMLLFTHITR